MSLAFLTEIPSALFMYILIEFPALLQPAANHSRLGNCTGVYGQDGRKFSSPRRERGTTARSHYPMHMLNEVKRYMLPSFFYLYIYIYIFCIEYTQICDTFLDRSLNSRDMKCDHFTFFFFFVFSSLIMEYKKFCSYTRMGCTSDQRSNMLVRVLTGTIGRTLINICRL